MWGRIANITAQLDANLSGEHNDQGVLEQGSQEESDFDGGGGGGVSSPPDSSYTDGDQDGWGDDDGFDDEFDFGADDDDDDDDGVVADQQPVENGGEHVVAAGKEEDQIVNGGENGHDLGDLATKTEDISMVADSAAVDYQVPDESTSMEPTDDVGKGEGGDVPIEAEEAQTPTLPQCQPQTTPQVVDQPDLVTVSAPGKALLAGGYLVLESPNPGLVLAAEGCRFHATVAFRPPRSEGAVVVIGNAADDDAGRESIPLDVYSPQFDEVFSYHLSYSPASGDDEDDASLRLRPRTGPREPNKFVERSLLLALGYLRQSLGADAFHARLQRQGSDNAGERVALAIKLRADNDFYSQINRLKERGLDLTPQNLERLEPFLPCPKDEATGELIVNKTGMGSSAALVTSIVGALLRFFGVISLPAGVNGEGENIDIVHETNGGEGKEKEGLRIAHNLSQICHCHAQGKVGSGFDVSSAVYGSHIYTRFSKGVINDFLESVTSAAKGENEEGLQLSEALALQLVGLVNDVEWDCTVSPVSLPPGLELLMADVCGGSESPSMARKVLDWKKNKRRTGFMNDYFWKDLKRCNKKIVSLLTEQCTSQSFLDGLRRDGEMIISSRTAEQWKKPMPSSWYQFEGSSWDVALKLLDLRMAFLECRQNLKGMGKAAGVPIEPDEQSALADATMKLPGVVAAGVPGAGGYDALFVIYVKGPETNDGKSDKVRDEIGDLWREMSEKIDETEVCPLSVRAAGANGLCSTKLDW